MFHSTCMIVAAAMWIHPAAPFEVDPKLSDLVSPPGHNGSGGGSGSQLRQWSSIIGIVTAIVGNILISFALNTQRYAHIRIEREHNETHQLTTKSGKGASRGRRNYGTTTQEDIAEERARLNANAPGPGERRETQKIIRASSHDSDDEA